MDGLCMNTALITSQIIVSDFRVAPLHVTPAVGRSPANVIPAEKASPSSSSVFSMKYPFTSLWPVRRRKLSAVESDDVVLEDDEMGAKRNSNWVLKILELRALRKDEDRNEIGDEGLKEEEKTCDSDEKCNCFGEEEHGVCNDDDDTKIVFDNGLFSKMLRRVNLGEARLYAQLCYLGRLAYSIPRIKPGSLLKYHGFHFVTSSLEKQEQAMKAEKEGVVTEIQEKEKVSAELEEMEKDLAKTTESIGAPVTAAKPQGMVEETEEKSRENQISAYIAYRIAASAASYLLSHTTSLLPFRSEMREDLSKDNVGNVGTMNRDVASVIATTDSVTSVVAAKEEVKQAVADNLNSTSSTPCQWFVCDDDQTSTRLFVIQGSESLASWQANLFFEPIQFEDFIRQELNQVRKTRRIHRRNILWPLVAPSVNGNIVVGKPALSSPSSNNGQLNFAGVLHTGRESFRRFSRLLSSRYLHLIIVFLFPVRMLILGAYNMINFH